MWAPDPTHPAVPPVATPAARRFRAVWVLAWAWKIAAAVLFVFLVIKLIGGR